MGNNLNSFSRTLLKHGAHLNANKFSTLPEDQLQRLSMRAKGQSKIFSKLAKEQMIASKQKGISVNERHAFEATAHDYQLKATEERYISTHIVHILAKRKVVTMSLHQKINAREVAAKKYMKKDIHRAKKPY
ncbi:MAG: hypothetical protein PHQ98_02800 [Candidatus ainarchaeum sp.]|nr:hypothetical protein [Candidatus ainarchaeum sp.]